MLKEKNGNCYFDLQVKPNSNNINIKFKKGIVYLSVTNPPVKNKANKEIIEFLSKLFNKKIEIVKNMPGYKKIIKVNNITSSEIKKYLGIN